jgi:hypothetical protein
MAPGARPIGAGRAAAEKAGAEAQKKPRRRSASEAFRKVVLILEHVPLGSRSKAWPAWTDVLLRTALYLAGVVVVLLLERGFEGRHEHGGFLPEVLATFEGSKGVHVWLNTICIGGALLGYNLSAVLRRNLGEGAFWRMLSRPLPLVAVSLLSLSTSWLDSP